VPQQLDYLARLLDGRGRPVGTGFQVSPGWLVTAWHALEQGGATLGQARVSLAPLGDGKAIWGTAERVLPAQDLALIRLDEPLSASIGLIAPSDDVTPSTQVAIRALLAADEADLDQHTTSGLCEGLATCDGVAALRVVVDSAHPGMSGAPVQRESDGAVIGVVSGLLTAAGGWISNHIWVARTEPLTWLMRDVGLAEPAPTRESQSPLDVKLTVSEDLVVLTSSDGREAAGRPLRHSDGLRNAIDELQRGRALAGTSSRLHGEDRDFAALTLNRLGNRLAEAFLPSAVTELLATLLTDANRTGPPLRLGVFVSGELARLPWEALPSPANGQPLALIPHVYCYRHTAASPLAEVPAPLRILVAIASPDDSEPLLDYERELRNILEAVRTARAEGAHVRVVEFATTSAIRRALDREPFHVLHISGHAEPGRIQLEFEDGQARMLTADQFVDEAIPPGNMPPLVALSACYTNVAAAADKASFAARLLERGAVATVATETSVTDMFATALFARLYETLASSDRPDVIAAVSNSRRLVQQSLLHSPNDDLQTLASLNEWAAVSVTAGQSAVRLYDPANVDSVEPPPKQARIGNIGERSIGDLVGRRQAQRKWTTELLSSGQAGIVLHGIGGIGKTTIASRIAQRVLEQSPGFAIVGLDGELSTDRLLRAIASKARQHMLVHHQNEQFEAQVLLVSRPDVSWEERFALLRDEFLSKQQLLILLDNFEDNLVRSDAVQSLHKVRDEGVAGLLARLATEPGLGRLLITSRHAFQLPNGAERHLSFHSLGPLTYSETLKLVWSLPALDARTPSEIEDVWRLVGGHPRSLEYLDALLAGGRTRFGDVSQRLRQVVHQRVPSGYTAEEWFTSHTEFDSALAEIVTIAADDVLLPDLLAHLAPVPGAERLLVGLSVYREPVDLNASVCQMADLASQVEVQFTQEEASRLTEIIHSAGVDLRGEVLVSFDGLEEPFRSAAYAIFNAARQRAMAATLKEPVDACANLSLVTIDDLDGVSTIFVHRWTAAEMERIYRISGRGDEVAEAHERGGEYWRWRLLTRSQDQEGELHDLLEARYHYLNAGDIGAALEMTEVACSRLGNRGAVEHEKSLIEDILRYLDLDHPRRAFLLHELGRLAEERGHYPEALNHYGNSFESAERLDDERDMIGAFHSQALVAHNRGDYREAEGLARQVVELAGRVDDRKGLAIGHGLLGKLARKRGDFVDARRHLELALETQDPEDLDGLAKVYFELGQLAGEQGDMRRALELLQRHFELETQLGNEVSIAAGLLEIGNFAYMQGDYTKARNAYQSASEIVERHEMPDDIAKAQLGLGMVARENQDFEEAEHKFHRALGIFESIDHPDYVAFSQWHLGILRQRQGRSGDAKHLFDIALASFNALGLQSNIANVRVSLGELAHEAGDDRAAIRHYENALAIAQRLGAAEPASQIRHIVARLRDSK
jgi:tetratricopeptide (TPR) repeat protein